MVKHFESFHANILGGIKLRIDDQDAQTQQRWEESHAILPEFEPGSLVKKLIPTEHSKLTPNWEGPFKIIKRSKSGSYVIQDSQDRIGNYKVPHEQLRLIRLPEVSEPNDQARNPSQSTPTNINLKADPRKSTLLGNWHARC